MKKIFLMLAICCAFAFQNAMAQEAKILPNFSFYNLKGEVATAEKIAYENYLTIVYFDPTCEHCIEQIEDIKKHWTHFSETVFVFISFADVESIIEFEKEHFPKKTEQVVFLHDKDLKIFDYFNDFYDTPTFKIYDNNKDLVGHLEQAPAQEIYKYYQQKK